MAEDFKGVPYRDDRTTPNYTTPDWSTVDPSSLSFTRQPSAVQKSKPIGSETYKSIGQQQGTVNDQEQQADQQSQNRNPDFYNNQKIINLNSNRYRGLGKRRRLRNDLRALGQDAVVWNGAYMQMASNFSGGQQFNRRNAMDMIRNGRQNAGMYSDNNFKAGTIEADANRRVHEYFSEHQNASRANWDHGNWQKPTETPISQSFQNMLQQYQGGYTPGAMTAYAQQLQPTWKQQTANTQVNAQPANTQITPRSNAAQSKRPISRPAQQNSWSWNSAGKDLTKWQNLVGSDPDGIYGENTNTAMTNMFGPGWTQIVRDDGTSEIHTRNGNVFFNTGRYRDKNGNMGWWNKNNISAPDKKNINTPKNQYANFKSDAFERYFDERKKLGVVGARLGYIKDSVKAIYDKEFADKYGKDKIGSADYNKAFNDMYQKFLKDHNFKDGNYNDYVYYK